MTVKYFCDNCNIDTNKSDRRALKISMNDDENRLLFEDNYDLCRQCAVTVPVKLRELIGSQGKDSKESR